MSPDYSATDYVHSSYREGFNRRTSSSDNPGFSYDFEIECYFYFRQVSIFLPPINNLSQVRSELVYEVLKFMA